MEFDHVESLTWEDIVYLAQNKYDGAFFSMLNDAMKLSKDGPWFVRSWSRDCDMCESTRTYKLETKQELVHSIMGEIKGWEWAEGPSGYEFIPVDEYGGEEYRTRDRVMEAYENGNGSSIWV